MTSSSSRSTKCFKTKLINLHREKTKLKLRITSQRIHPLWSRLKDTYLKLTCAIRKAKFIDVKRVRLNWFSEEVSASAPVVARGSLGNKGQCTDWPDTRDNGTSFFSEVSFRGHLSCSSSVCSSELVLDAIMDNGRVVGYLNSLAIPCSTPAINIYTFLCQSIIPIIVQ